MCGTKRTAASATAGEADGEDEDRVERACELDWETCAGDPAAESCGHDRAHHAHAGHRADGAEELNGGRRDAYPAPADGVLHGHGERLHHQADAEADDDDVARDGELGRVRRRSA